MFTFMLNNKTADSLLPPIIQKLSVGLQPLRKRVEDSCVEKFSSPKNLGNGISCLPKEQARYTV